MLEFENSLLKKQEYLAMEAMKGHIYLLHVPVLLLILCFVPFLFISLCSPGRKKGNRGWMRSCCSRLTLYFTQTPAVLTTPLRSWGCCYSGQQPLAALYVPQWYYYSGHSASIAFCCVAYLGTKPLLLSVALGGAAVLGASPSPLYVAISNNAECRFPPRHVLYIPNATTALRNHKAIIDIQ